MTSKMSYPKILQWRIRSLWLALIAMLIFMVYIGETGRRDSRVITGIAYNLGNLLYWAGLMLLSYVFRYGEELQKLSDETI